MESITSSNNKESESSFDATDLFDSFQQTILKALPKDTATSPEAQQLIYAACLEYINVLTK